MLATNPQGHTLMRIVTVSGFNTPSTDVSRILLNIQHEIFVNYFGVTFIFDDIRKVNFTLLNFECKNFL